MVDKQFAEKSSYYWEKEPVINYINTSHKNNKFNLVDLCCGAGGLSKGLSNTGKIRSILGVDIFTNALETYQKNNPDASTILGDVREITNEMYASVIKENKVDIVAAGVPCQGFSLANIKRNVEDERNFLFLEVVRFVDLYNPKIVIIENVSGMKTLGNGQFVDVISEAIGKAGDFGYTVKNRLLNAADYGVPQIRKRLIFIGVRNDIKMDFQFPEPEFGFENKPYNTIYDAISDLPPLNNNEEKYTYDSLPKTDFQKLMRKNVLDNVLRNHKSPKHPESTVEKIENTTPGHPMYPNYKQRIRLSWNMQSPTQLAGGIRPQFQFGHPEQPRGLTIRERARIQSFPDDFVFSGGVVQGRVQTGNAVPPLLAQNIGISVLKILEKKELLTK